MHKYFLGGLVTLALASSPAIVCQAGEGPDSVELNALAYLYEPVSFDHAMHEGIASSCAVCHHHTTGTPVENPNCARCHADSKGADVVACRDCHAEKRFEAEYMKSLAANNMLYHVDKVGLKAAYHLNCMGCHETMGAPTGCQDCHPRNDAGDKMFRSGQYTPPKQAASEGGHGGGH